MDFVENWQERRGEIVELYQKGLKEIDGIILPNISKGHAKHLYVIKLHIEKWSISRNRFIYEMNDLSPGL